MSSPVRWVWVNEPSPSPPQSGEVYLQLLDCAVSFPQDWEMLTETERVRAQRYRRPQAQAQFVRCRAQLRRWLGSCLRTDPHRVAISYANHGKPVLAEPACGLHFSVAHSGPVGLIGLARAPLGVDVEAARSIPDLTGLVHRFFNATEIQQYERLPPEQRCDWFFRTWTLKEAVIKAAGLSIAALAEFAVQQHHGLWQLMALVPHAALAHSWSLRDWQRDDLYLAAAVCGELDQ